MERREKKKGEAEGQTEVTRDLPNGVMTISLTPAWDSGNAGPPLDRKLGFHQYPFFRRYIVVPTVAKRFCASSDRRSEWPMKRWPSDWRVAA